MRQHKHREFLYFPHFYYELRENVMDEFYLQNQHMYTPYTQECNFYPCYMFRCDVSIIYINKPKRCTFCMYLFYNFCTTLYVSKDHFVHHQEFMIYSICSSVQTMQTCVTAVSYGCSNRKTQQLDTSASFTQSCRYSKS